MPSLPGSRRSSGAVRAGGIPDSASHRTRRSMETILVTGGAGFIGSNIAHALAARGDRVVVLDDLSSGRLENIDHLLHRRNFTFIRGSILDTGLLRSLLKTYQVSCVCHQAADPSVAKSIIDPVRSIETNITGTANVFDLASENGCRRRSEE